MPLRSIRRGQAPRPPQFTLRWLLAFVTGAAVLCGLGRQIGPDVAFAVAAVILAGVLVVSLVLLLPWRTTAAGAVGALVGWLLDALSWGWGEPYPPSLLAGAAAGLCLMGSGAAQGPGTPSSVIPLVGGSPPRWLRVALLGTACGLPLVTLLIGWSVPFAWRHRFDFSWSEMATLMFESLRNEDGQFGLVRHLGSIWPAHLFATLSCIAAFRQRRFMSGSLESENGLFKVALRQCLAALFLALFAATMFASMFRLLSLDGNWYSELAFPLAILTLNAASVGLLLALSSMILGRRLSTMWRRYGWLPAVGIVASATVALMVAWTLYACLARSR
jgi:hypothetical protein